MEDSRIPGASRSEHARKPNVVSLNTQTWLDLTTEDIARLLQNPVCLYGKKGGIDEGW